MSPAGYLQRLRTLAKRLPDTGETASWGHPNFTAGGRIFASVEVYKGRPCMAIATSIEEQSMLVESRHFMRAPYTGKYGWVSALLDTHPDWDLLESLLRGAHERKLAKAAISPVRARAKKRTKQR